MPSVPQTYTISDFVEWHDRKQLELSPDFQRGAVWTPTAQVFLIDTILKQFPIPQIYVRTKISTAAKTTVREVVDGQQRLRAILEFASGKLKLTKRSRDFAGLTYNELSPELQENFLSYGISTVQLINASDSEVLEVFSRLNSYSVKVTPPELRHARWSTPIKWAIWDTTRAWTVLWENYKVVSIREAVRLRNTSVVSELYMCVDVGVGDGGEDKIDRFYNSKKDETEEEIAPISDKVNAALTNIVDIFGKDLEKTTFFDSPNFLVLFAAYVFLTGDSPGGPISEGMENLHGTGIKLAGVIDRLQPLASAVENEELDGPLARFVSASKSSTQRISSRKVRFEFVVRALAG